MRPFPTAPATTTLALLPGATFADAFSIDLDDADALKDVVFRLDCEFRCEQIILKGEDVTREIRTETVSSAASQARDETTALKGSGKPNPYEGMLSADGQSARDRWAHQNPLLKGCIAAWEKGSGTTLLGPDDANKDKNGDREETYVGVTDFCGELLMFKTIAEHAGGDLTNDSWIAAVNSFGPIKLVPTDYASLCAGKYSADDAARLVSFDSTIGVQGGDWKPLTDIGDSSN